MIRFSGYAVLAVAGLLLGAILQDWRMGEQLAEQGEQHASQLQRITDEHNAALARKQAERLELEQRLQTIDATHYQELTHARAETIRLAADLRAADRRLSIRTTGPACPADSVPTTTGPASLDHGAGRADIHAEDAAAIVTIAGDADACAVQLGALQEWARAVMRR